jgi:salicylate hydroxylase
VTLPLIIVGAGIAGLATSLALATHGIGCVVIERRPEPSDDGAGIQIGPNGVACLERLGLRAALEPRGRVPQAIHVCDGVSGRTLTRLPLGSWIAERHGAPYWVVHRADLMAVLLSAAARARVDVRYGCEIAHLGQDERSVQVVLTSGETLTGSALIGADGLWSQVRSRYFDASAPCATGRAAARAMLARSDVPAALHDVVSVWMAGDAHVVTYPVARGDGLNVVVIAHASDLPAAWSTDLSVAEAVQRVAGFAAPVVALVRGAATWRQWPLVTRSPLAAFATGRVAVVGDAAHPMLPYLAQGAVMALEDALALADAVVARSAAPVAALKDYSVARVSRTNAVAAAAARNGRIYHLTGAMAVARNTVLRTLPAARLMAGYDWIYGFRR